MKDTLRPWDRALVDALYDPLTRAWRDSLACRSSDIEAWAWARAVTLLAADGVVWS